MIEIPLEAIPNQSFSIALDNRIYDFTIKSTNGVMSVSLTRDNVEIIANIRAIADFPLIPFKYLEDGNFIIQTQNGDLPEYSQFGITQRLLYFSAAELGDIRAGT